MTIQFWRNLGYLLCLIGLWLGVQTMDGNALSLRYEIVAQISFWAGAAVLAIALLFDWVDQSDKKEKK
ncbi:MAG: hypothetical protein J6D61_08690 [Clostridia bacterium]|nr:hypothetical protein [Clostridia bacterium]